MRMTSFVAAAALAAACLPAAAQSLKPGLWEMHNKMGGNPQMDKAMADMQKQMAAMPPEQRKQMEAMMGKQGMQMAPGKGGGMAMKVCMTKEQTERNEVPMQDGCKITSLQRNGNTTKMAYSCANPPSTGEGEFTLQSPEAHTSKMTVKAVVNGKTETTTMAISSRRSRRRSELRPVQPNVNA